MSDSDGGGGEPNVNEESPYISDVRLGPAVPHYYGDYVRQIFMLCAAVMLVTAPFLSAAIPAALPFEIGGAIVIAILGALTSPTRKISILANSIAAAGGVIVYELLAMTSFSEGAMIAFILREALVIAFLFALYFSLKTLRNMTLGMIGKKATYGDFIDPQS